MTLRPEDLPPVQQALLVDATLDELVADLEALADIREVTLKQAASEHSDRDQVPLKEAIGLLRSGGVRGVQVHYAHEGRLWTDTLMVAPGGIRLVRMAT
ncbi:MAG: hypothetical protein OXU20_42020 [Myxococcales bacterium]|nr:hypothetical protein [Myxococcales bacterium]MDD9968718.1 hypothetical protein [Myxococcales bacterium]